MENFAKYAKYGCLGIIIFPVICLVLSLLFEAGDSKTKKNISQAIETNNFGKARELVTDLYGDEKDELVEKINRSEITYLYKMGEIERAHRVALENNAINIYQKIIAENIPSLLAEKKFEQTYNILSNWTFFEDPVYSATNVTTYEVNELNKEYNSEIGTYNDMVFKLFNAALVDNQKGFIKRTLLLFQDELVLKSKTENGDYLDMEFKKDNKALREAKQKLAEYNNLK